MPTDRLTCNGYRSRKQSVTFFKRYSGKILLQLCEPHRLVLYRGRRAVLSVRYHQAIYDGLEMTDDWPKLLGERDIEWREDYEQLKRERGAGSRPNHRQGGGSEEEKKRKAGGDSCLKDKYAANQDGYQDPHQCTIDDLQKS